jgi:hypothetical protein
MKRGFAGHLLVQAVVAGSAFLALVGGLFLEDSALTVVRTLLLLSLGGHLALTWLEEKAAPAGREFEYERAVRLLTRGPFARMHWIGGVVVGVVLPVVLLLLPVSAALPLAGLLALIGLRTAEDAFVRAGQALPIS